MPAETELPLERNQYTNNSPAFLFLYYNRGMYSHQHEFPQEFGKYVEITSQKKSCIRASANSGGGRHVFAEKNSKDFAACIDFVTGGIVTISPSELVFIFLRDFFAL